MSRITLAAALLLVACRGETPHKTDVPVFIISIDTLRSDRLPAYGYGVVSTPAIDSLRNDAILFQHAFSHVPLTLPSHASILTGRLPAAHRVRDNAGYTMPSDMAVLPRLLRENGYATGAAVSSFVLRSETGISSGCDFFDDDLDPGEEERDGDRTRAALSRWLDGIPSKRVFGFLHLFEPHAPYEGGYDAEVVRADTIVGRFLAELKQRGLYDPALIVLLSDHGEGLGDHGEDEHGVFLYREAIQVPLLVKLPQNQRAGGTVSRSVGLIDVFPTIVDALGLPAPENVDGTTLLAPELPLRRIYSETFFPRLHLGWSESFSLVDDEYHYINAPRSELFRYRADPTENTNLIGEERRIAAAMRSDIGAIDRSLNAPSAVSREERESLAALGYIGSSASPQATLPDAKDRILFLRSLKAGLSAHAAGEHRRAADILRMVIRDAPELVDAWSVLAEAQLRLGRTSEAISTLRSASARFATHPDVRPRLAQVLLDSGNLDGAEQVARDALSTNEAGGREILAKVALARGDFTRADSELRAALAKDPTRLSLLLAGAQIASRQRRFAQALALLESAEEQIRLQNRQPVRELHSRKAEALLELRRLAEGEQEFRREVELFPDHLEAWGGLAVTQAAQRKVAESRETLREAMARNEGPRARKLARETLVAIGDSEGLRVLALR